MKVQIFLSSLILLLMSCSASRNVNPVSNNAPTSGKPGACYAKCLMMDQYEEVQHTLPVYTGNNVPAANVEKKIIQLAPGGTRWVKKKMDGNCMSANPDDCLVWCLVDAPAETVEVLVVKDTEQAKDFEWKNFQEKKLIQKGGHTEWREVVCQKDINESLLKKVNAKLLEEGFLDAPAKPKFNEKVKAALTQYQKAKKLPVGHLDFETLKKMGI